MVVVVQALLVLARAPRGMATSAEVADAIGIHPVVVRRSLAALRAEGIVESRPGPTGGWAIARDPARITLGGIHRLLVGERAVVAPPSLGEALADAEDAYLARLDRVTLASLMG